MDVDAVEERILLSKLSELERESLLAVEGELRERSLTAAQKCAEALLAYIRANPALLWVETLPEIEAEELRKCLTLYVATLRALATPPERAIVAVNELVRGATVGTGIDPRGLTAASVSWAIAGYYPESARQTKIDRGRDVLDPVRRGEGTSPRPNDG